MPERLPDADRSEHVMSFGDHLDELRKRLILSLIAPLPLAIVLFLFAEPIRTFLCRPLIAALRANRLPAQLQTLHPVETLMLDLKLAIILALVVSGPWIVWQAWLFIAPGLYRHERRFVRFLLPASALLMCTGLVLLHFVVLPLMLTVLVGFGVTNGADELPPPRVLEAVADVMQGSTEGDGAESEEPAVESTPPSEEGLPAPLRHQGSADAAAALATQMRIPSLAEHPAQPMPGEVWIKTPENLLCIAVEIDGAVEVLATTLGRGTMIVQQYRLSEYINFVLVMTAGVAIGFQLPLVILLLGWLDILRLETLRSKRTYALMACAVIAAVITPPDLVSMLLTLIPLYLLYELGVILLAYLPAWRVMGLEPPRVAPAPTPAAASGSVGRGAPVEGPPAPEDVRDPPESPDRHEPDADR